MRPVKAGNGKTILETSVGPRTAQTFITGKRSVLCVLEALRHLEQVCGSQKDPVTIELIEKWVRLSHLWVNIAEDPSQHMVYRTAIYYLQEAIPPYK